MTPLVEHITFGFGLDRDLNAAGSSSVLGSALSGKSA